MSDLSKTLGVTQDDKAAFDAMNDTVFLAAQLQVASGDMGSGIQDLFNKSAKYYYGIQNINGDDKRMYNKNTSLMDKARFSTENAKKNLDTPEQVDTDNIKTLKDKVQKLLEMNTLPQRDTTNDLFTTLQIAEKGMVNMGTGARVVLMAKYSKNSDNVSAFGKLLFIKRSKTDSLNLVIKENKIMMGTGAGSKITMNSLLQTLFDTKNDFTFEENPLVDSAQSQSQPQSQSQSQPQSQSQSQSQPAITPAVGSSTPLNADAKVFTPAAGSDTGNIIPTTEATFLDKGDDANAPTASLGGKSTRRKRKGSRKKGSSKKPASHKKRKSGASKKKRSHPKKK